MIVLQVNGITKSFSGTDILQNVRLEVQHRDRVALVGRNGAGKSTLLKIIAGEMSADSGDLIMPKDVQVGYLEQHAGIDSSLTIWDEMLTVFTPLLDMEKRLRKLEAQMADPSVYENPEEYERVMKDYDALQVEFKDSGGYQYESDMRSVLHGMRFYPEDYDKNVNSVVRRAKNASGACEDAAQQTGSPHLGRADEPFGYRDTRLARKIPRLL